MHTSLVIFVAQYSKTPLLLYPQMEYFCTRQYAEYAKGTQSVVKDGTNGIKGVIYHYTYILVILTRLKNIIIIQCHEQYKGVRDS